MGDLKVIKIDTSTVVDEGEVQLVELIMQAIAEEIQAANFYMSASYLYHGKQMEAIRTFFSNTFWDELNDHAAKLLERVTQLVPDAVPSTSDFIGAVLDVSTFTGAHTTPVEISAQSEHGPDFELLLKTVDLENVSILTYNTMADLAVSIDDKVTEDLARDILKDEEQHLKEVRDFIESIK